MPSPALMEGPAAGYGSSFSSSFRFPTSSNTPTPALGKVSPLASMQCTFSSSLGRASPASAAGPLRGRRTFMACTECRRRQVKCNPSSTPGQPCQRCAKRQIKCEYLTRHEQQLQSTNEWDPSYMDSSAVTLRLPHYGSPASQDPQDQVPAVSPYQPVTLATANVPPGPILANAGYNDGLWNLQSMSSPPAQCQTTAQEYYAANLVSSSTAPTNYICLDQQVMEPYGCDGGLDELPGHQLAEETAAQWYPDQEQLCYDVQNSNLIDQKYVPQHFPPSSPLDWQWQIYYNNYNV